MNDKRCSAQSIAAHLTDVEILREASLVDEMNYDSEIGSFGGFSCGDNSPSTARISAVLREYVRLRMLVNDVGHKYNAMVNSHVTATIDGTEYYQPFRASEVNEIKRLLADAEKERPNEN